MSERKNIGILYSHYYDVAKGLSLEQNGLLLLALLHYINTWEIPELSDQKVAGVFSMIKSRFDYDANEHNKKCEQNRQNALKRYQNKAEIELEQNYNQENEFNST